MNIDNISDPTVHDSNNAFVYAENFIYKSTHEDKSFFSNNKWGIIYELIYES